MSPPAPRVSKTARAGPVHGELGAPGLEAAVVLVVVDEQRRPRREHAGEDVVVGGRAQVGGALFQIAHVGGAPAALPHGRVAGHGNGNGDALVEGGEDRRLPAAAGEAGHGHPLRVGVAVGEEHVEAALHQQVEHADAGDAAEVEEADAHVVAVRAQLPHADELGVEGQHAALGEVDAARLLVVHRLAAGVVAVGVEHGGHLAAEAGGLVEQGGHPQAGVALVAQLADAVAGAGVDHAAPLDAGLLLEDAGGMAAQEQLEDGGAGLGGAALPGRRRGRPLQAREPLVEEGEQLPARGALSEEAAGQGAFHLHHSGGGGPKARRAGRARQRERRRRKPTGAWIPLVLLLKRLSWSA